MNHIKIADTTLSDEKSTLSFKQKLEIARKLERLGVDAVELPEVGTAKAESLLVRTAASFVKGSVLSVAAASSSDAIDRAADALSTASRPRIRVELPMTASIMEYTLHIKQQKMCDHVKKMVEKDVKDWIGRLELLEETEEGSRLSLLLRSAPNETLNPASLLESLCAFSGSPFDREALRVTRKDLFARKDGQLVSLSCYYNREE